MCMCGGVGCGRGMQKKLQKKDVMFTQDLNIFAMHEIKIYETE